jgi:hypothetical protein
MSSDKVVAEEKLVGGMTTNFYSWRKAVGAELQEKFGRAARFIADDSLADAVVYVVPQVDDGEWNPIIPTGVDALTTVQKTNLFLEATKGRAKLVRELPDKVEKLYAALTSKVSLSLWSEVEAHKDYTEAKLLRCPYRLWNIILKVALTDRDSHCDMAKTLAKFELRKTFDRLTQKATEPIHEFKTRFQDMIGLMVASGEPVMTQPEMALVFLHKLDRQRYVHLQVQMRNSSELGVSPPATLEAMFRVAAARQEVHATTGKGATPSYHVALVANARRPMRTTVGSHSGVIPNRAPVGPQVESSRSGIGSEYIKYNRNSQQEQSKKKRVERLPPSSRRPKETSTEWQERLARMVCFRCQEKGHVAGDCTAPTPVKKAAALVTRVEDNGSSGTCQPPCRVPSDSHMQARPVTSRRRGTKREEGKEASTTAPMWRLKKTGVTPTQNPRVGRTVDGVGCHRAEAASNRGEIPRITHIPTQPCVQVASKTQQPRASRPCKRVIRKGEQPCTTPTQLHNPPQARGGETVLAALSEKRTVTFGTRDVLLDNAASVGIFSNSELVDDVHPCM